MRQQHDAGHAGLTFALAKTAAGHASMTLIPEEREVMAVKSRINLLAPAIVDDLIARGRLLRAGRRLVVVTAAAAGQVMPFALLQGTMMPVDPA